MIYVVLPITNFHTSSLAKHFVDLKSINVQLGCALLRVHV